MRTPGIPGFGGEGLTMAATKQTEAKSKRTRVFLVDDHAVVRFGIAQLINRDGSMEVCGEGDVAGPAFTAICKAKPDLVIADISLKESSGLELVRNIKSQFPKLPVLIVSGHDEQVYAEIAFRAGAMGYLMKQGGLDDLLVAIKRVLSGSIYVSDALGAKMLQQQIQGRSSIKDSPVSSLSDREMEIFQLIGRWKKTSQIASELNLSIKTVEYYREQIKHKLNLNSGSELTQYATSWVQREMPG